MRDTLKVELVTQYLNDLEQFVKDLPAHVNRRAVIPTWEFFVQGHITLEKMTKTLHIQDNAALGETALDLAFLRNYPHHFSTKAFTRHEKMRAIRCKSKCHGKRLLSKLISKFDQEAKYSNMLLHILRKGFEGPFLKSEEIIEPLLRKIMMQAGSWCQSEHLAPYSLLVGPAMSGKTRALHELSNHVCVVYICLRPPTSSGHPPRSALAPTMLPPGMTTSALEKHYNKFLTATFQVVADFFRAQNETISDEKTKLKNWFAYNFSNDLKFEESNQFSRDVLKKMETCSPLKYGQENEQLQKALADMQSQAGFVLLAIDEAHALLSSPNAYLEHATSFFPSFRRSLRETLSDGVFTILTGASSLMLFNTTPDPYKSNPEIKWYPDAQLPLWLSGHKLLDPINQLGTFDAMVSAITQPGTWTDLVSADRLVSYGSPFFAACFRDAIACHQERNLILWTLTELALSKLLGANSDTVIRQERCSGLQAFLTAPQALALLGPTIQPQLSGALHLSGEMILSHAAHCKYVKPDSNLIVGNYPSQFFLASAANTFRQSHEPVIVECIKKLTEILRLGLDSKQVAREIASKIILLRAMHEAVPYSHSLDLGPDISEEHRINLLKNGMVFWNHFNEIHYTPDSEDLLKFLHRGMAAQCASSKQSSFDHLFTIYLKPENSDRLDEEHVTFCGISVKDQITEADLKIRNHEWTDTHSGIRISNKNPYLVLLMSLTTKAPSDHLQRLPKPAGQRRASQTLSPTYLSSIVASRIMSLEEVCPY
ncbi:hypothetical protein PCANC_10021 [Puccinia coronata f. sp. avenae]|uniref:Uncharacterized protein n=1 Tax=Puccinia coronata f. sp. avenae TaxID=200324 RepID=A0A2N5UZ04_9BASI|nr:hypothetical protein PCANC_10021 [Puccinia coronata f. sp. avenae]